CGHVAVLLDNVRTGEPISKPTRDWLDTIDLDWRDRLAKFGLLSQARAADAREIGVHIDEWAKGLGDNGRSEARVAEATLRAKRFAELAGFERLSDIAVEGASTAMEKLGEEGWSANTRRCYKQVFGQFCSWCVRRGRLPD